jgi:hypothetical protein
MMITVTDSRPWGWGLAYAYIYRSAAAAATGDQPIIASSPLLA